MLDSICIPIKEGLARVEEVLSSELVSGIDTVDAITKYATKNGGKRIRPAIFLFAARMAGFSGDSLPRLAAALEMVHTASLLHDDVVDGATLRRGQPSANAKWGNQLSVLVGDFLLCRASDILVREGKQRLTEAMTAAITATTEGELLEIVHQNDVTISVDTYLKVIRGKTAALFAFAAKAGAVVAGVSPELEDAFGRYGFNVGQAFQLADDALDYIADEERFGKQAGIDLREGKLTYPLIVALSKGTTAEKAAVREALIMGHPTKERFAEVTAMIGRYDGIESTWNMARELAAAAKKEFAVFKPSIERDALLAIADYAVERRE